MASTKIEKKENEELPAKYKKYLRFESKIVATCGSIKLTAVISQEIKLTAFVC